MSPYAKVLLGSVGSCLLLSASPAGAASPAALSGQVSSAKEGQMEGVLVSAKKDGLPMTITVVSDDKGHYSFPADHLPPGHYTVSIRAVGYDLDGSTSADVAADKTTTDDLTLVSTKNIEAQLSNGEWLNSFPVADDQKRFLTDCTGCHRLDRPANSKFTVGQWPDIIRLMATMSAESVPEHAQPLLPGPRNRLPTDKVLDAASKVLVKLNLSGSQTHDYPMKPNPRPTGRATHVIYTEYDLPTKFWWPHDVVVGKNNDVWFADFGDQYVGNMDLATGKVTRVALPLMKNDGSPQGNLDLEWGSDGKLWVAMMYQGGIGSVDPVTHEVKTYKLPDSMQNASTQESFVAPQHHSVDGMVWTNNQDTHSAVRLNLKTGKFEPGSDEKTAQGDTIAAYQIISDSKNDIYLLNFGGTKIGLVNKATGVADGYVTPIGHSRPRRGVVDKEDRLWFAEFGGNSVGMFDPKTQKIQEWQVPLNWAEPYDVDYSDKYNEAWSGSMLTDFVNRLDVKSGKYTEYLLPRFTNIRRVTLDDRGPKPVLWIGSNHGASIIKLEALD